MYMLCILQFKKTPYIRNCFSYFSRPADQTDKNFDMRIVTDEKFLGAHRQTPNGYGA